MAFRLSVVAPLAFAAALVGACTSVLGNDFVITDGGGGSAGTTSQGGSPDGGGGSGAAGGQGGVGGGGGDAPRYPLSCAWGLPSHVFVSTLNPNTSSFSDMEAIGRGSGDSSPEVRVFVERPESGGGFIELWTLSATTAVSQSIVGTQLEDLQRLDDNAVGLLHRRLGSQRDPIVLTIVSDDDATGASNQTRTVVSESAMSDNIGSSSHSKFAAEPAGSTRYPLRLMVGYRVQGDGYIEKFGIYDGNSLSKFERLTLPNLNLSSGAVDVRRVLYHQGTTIAFSGFGGSSVGPRLYTFDDNVVGPINSHVYAPENAFVLDAVSRPAGVNVGLPLFPLTMNDTFKFHVGQVSYNEIGNLDLMDLPLAKEWSLITEMPGGSGAYRWIDDIFAFVATTTASSTQLKYALFDELGNERAEGLLPFNGMLPAGASREDVDNLALAPLDRDIATNGGRIHVAWTERHADSNNVSYDVLLYDQLECTLQIP